MKQYTPVIAIIGIVGVVVLASMFTASPLQSPEAKLFRQIDGQVEIAKRMLWDYNPADIRLAAVLGPSASQPADLPTEKWQQTLQDLERSSVDPALEQRKSALSDSYARLNGEPPEAVPSPDGARAYQTLQERLDRNAKLLSDALKIVQEARGLSDGEVSGADHPTATRLEAILCYQQADLNRRQAAVQMALADQAREQFDQSTQAWSRLEVEVTSISRELGQEHGLVTLDGGAPSASTPTRAPAAVGDKAAGTQKGRGVVGRLINSVFGGLGKSRTPPKTATVEAADKAPQVPEKTPQAEPPAVITPPLGARIAQLAERKSQVEAAIRAAEEAVQKVSGQIEDTKKRLDAARAQASETEQKMFKLEDEGVKTTDPGVLDQFIKAYNEASAVNRVKFRESAMLAEGALKDAKIEAANEDEMLTAPLTGAQGAERGLVALRSDLKAEEALVESNTALLKEIERQIADLHRRQGTLTKQLAQLKSEQATCAEQAGQAAKAAIAAMLEAEQLTTKGLELAEGAGQQAAQRAKEAAGKRMREAEEANATNAPESRNPRLTLIASNRFTTGHAIALEGDMAYVAAMILAQREEGLRRHAGLLAALETLGIQPDAALLPEGVNAAEVPPAIVKSLAAETSAEEAHAAAIKAARLALEKYNQADEPLKQLWVLHAHLGAINYLLANLSTGEEAQQYLAQARQQYQRALKGQEEQPAAQAFKEVLAGMTSAAR